MKKVILFLTMFVSGVTVANLVIVSNNVIADDTRVPTAGMASGQSEDAQARFRLRDDFSPSMPEAPQVTPDIRTADDFNWEKLTADGLKAAGKNPIVGKGSGKTFYSFADGQPKAEMIRPTK